MRGGLFVMPVDTEPDSQREKKGPSSSHASSNRPPAKTPQSARPSKPKESSPLPTLSKKTAHGRSSSETNNLSNIDENSPIASTSLYLNPSPHRHFPPQPLTPSFLLESDTADDAQQQAMEILASLTSLGISTQLRQRVQEALSKELDKDSSSASTSAQEGASHAASSSDSNSKAGSMSGGAKAKSSTAASKAMASKDAAATKKLMTAEELEKKLALSRSIMRKLYHKTVHLEKEVQLLKANSRPMASSDPKEISEEAGDAQRPTTAMSTHSTFSSSPSPSSIPSGLGPVAQAIQERDRTISQLQQALDASRRRCALLEGLEGSGSPAAASTTRQQQQAVADLMAQSSLHLNKYKQIRDDYNGLLFKRSGAVSSSKLANQAAKELVEDMQARLNKEIEEREAEAALYSSRLYESERAMADLFVERRGLQDQVAKLNQDILHRDRLDAEIEACVCSLFERTRLLEEENAALNSRLHLQGGLNNDGVQSSAAAPHSDPRAGLVSNSASASRDPWPTMSDQASLPSSVSAIIARGKEERESIQKQQLQREVLSLEAEEADGGGGGGGGGDPGDDEGEE